MIVVISMHKITMAKYYDGYIYFGDLIPFFLKSDSNAH